MYYMIKIYRVWIYLALLIESLLFITIEYLSTSILTWNLIVNSRSVIKYFRNSDRVMYSYSEEDCNKISFKIYPKNGTSFE